MKNIMKTLSTLALFTGVTILLFLYPAKCLAYTFTGLNLWFEKMVPALFPFMVLSGIMIRMNLTDRFVFLLRPLLQPVFKMNDQGLFAIIGGFLFGFPMGARIITDLYTRGRITKAQATYLLAFCNNLGPIYFITFALTALDLPPSLPYLFGMYGLPLCYGVLLRHTAYKKIISHTGAPVQDYSAAKTSPGFLAALDDSITSALHGITRLGGYMIFFNLLNILPFVFPVSESSRGLLSCLLEITNGINTTGSSSPLFVLILLPFGGLSCIAQTYSVIKESDLSIGTYILHKLVLTGITAGYYLLLACQHFFINLI